MRKTLTIISILVLLQCVPANKPNIELINEVIKQNCSVTEASKGLVKILESFYKKGYVSTYTIENDDLVFGYRQEMSIELIESIRIKDCERIEYLIKKNVPISGNHYVKFGITEFCFDSIDFAEQYYQKLKEIVGKQEKKYEYILLNEDKLLYLNTGVNMYNSILQGYVTEIENILKESKLNEF